LHLTLIDANNIDILACSYPLIDGLAALDIFKLQNDHCTPVTWGMVMKLNDPVQLAVMPNYEVCA
jgi:hypothetical protein